MLPGVAARAEAPPIGAVGEAGAVAWRIEDPARPRPALAVIVPADDAGDAAAHRQPLLDLAEPVAAIAGWADRIWIVSGTPDATTLRPRPVGTLAVRRHPVHGGWYVAAPGWPEPAPPLPGDGTLALLVGTPSGPVAFLRGGLGDRLLRLRGGAWERLALPESGLPPGPLVAVATGPAAAGLWIAGRDGEGLRWLRLEALDEAVTRRAGSAARAPRWTEGRDAGRGRPRAAVRIGDAPVVVTGRGGRLGLHLVRPEGIVPLADLGATPRGRWSLAGLASGAVLVEERGGDALPVLRRLDAAGAAAAPRELPERPADVAGIVRGPILLAILVFLGMLAASLPREPVEPRPGRAIAPPMRRLLATLVDGLPGALLALLLLDAEPRDLLWLPFLAPAWSLAVPYLVAAGITALLVGAIEIAGFRTPGKVLLGLAIERPDGGTPGLDRRVRRAAVKAIVLLVPAFALVALATPDLRAPHDRLAGTLVTTAAPEPEAPDAR